jgi:hypothetical protein
MPSAYNRGRPYHRNLKAVLAESDLCGICGHPGAHTGDHIIPVRQWPRDDRGKLLPGVDSKENLMPAHGTMRPGHLNPCPVCHRLCNQSKGGRRRTATPRSRDW